MEEFPVVAFSVAYEIEIAGMLRMLDASNIPALREERDERHPLILAGGPLTFSNPLPLAPFIDAMIVGEAEEIMPVVMQILATVEKRHERIEELAKIPHVFVPDVHGSILPIVAKVDDSCIPAWGPIRTPNAVLRNMFLIETERGCSRTCTYCVMRRSTNGGMRMASKERILEIIPKDATRVGLVGAAVSDHPKIVEIVRTLDGARLRRGALFAPP